MLAGAPSLIATTSTSSGKSLLYMAPIAQAYLGWQSRVAAARARHHNAQQQQAAAGADDGSRRAAEAALVEAVVAEEQAAPRALLIFPTKALAHDQLLKLHTLLGDDSDGGSSGTNLITLHCERTACVVMVLSLLLRQASVRSQSVRY